MRLRNILPAVGVFFAALLTAFGFLWLSAEIPNEKIENNMKSSAEYFKTAEAFADENGRLGGIADNYADAILLGIAWNMGRGDGIAAVLDTRYNDGGALGENYGFYESVVSGAEANTDYTRYVHGSAAFVRIFHLFGDIKTMKSVGLAVISALILLNALILLQKKQPLISAAFVLSFLLIGFWNVARSLEYMPTFMIALLIIPLYTALEQRGDAPLLLLSVAGGTLVAFFDFLTTETVALLLPLMTVLAQRSREGRLGTVSQNTLMLIKNALAFTGSYAAVFLIKWTAATLVTGENKFSAALSSAGERIGGYTEGAGNIFARIPSALAANLTAAFGGAAGTRVNLALALFGSLIFSGVIASLVFLFRKPEADKGAAALLGVAASTVPLRFSVLCNHSYMHCFFTYRALVSVIYALLLVVIIFASPPRRAVSKGGGRK